MSKGVVVVKLPESCSVCDFSSMEPGDEALCTINIGNISEYVMDDTKPWWCPIKPLPERVEHKSRQGLLQERVALGWNLCLDTIMEGRDE